MTGWQEIETAPKTGKFVLLVDTYDRWPWIGRWVPDLGDDGLWAEELNALPDEQPTHWMPIPDPPK